MLRVNNLSGFGTGQAAGPTCGPDGTVAIFQLGVNSTTALVNALTTRNKYTFSTDVSGTATAASQNTNGASAAGNSTRGIFNLSARRSGEVANLTSARNKYTYACDTNTTSGVASASANGVWGTATGNNTRGIFARGSGSTGGWSNVREKYTYACDTNASATASSSVSGYGAAVGNLTRGIFHIGCICTSCGSPSSIRNKYTYACDTSAVATAATVASQAGAAAGNATRGIFALGNGTTTRNKYTYACDTNVAATASSGTSNIGSAAGNSTRGIFTLGFFNTTRNKYTYACDTSTATGVGGQSVSAIYGTAASFATGANS